MRQSIVILCCALALVAFVLDLFTPQLFIAAILLNVPIALSGLTSNARLTFWLMMFAQLANIAAGYFNGVQDGNSWDSIAIANRVLVAASFAISGFLTMRVQRYAFANTESEQRVHELLRRTEASNDEMRRIINALRETAEMPANSFATITQNGEKKIPITARETEILRLIAEGVGNAEIAERLHLGLGTVKGHVRDILDRLGAADRTQAAVIALKRGYI